MQTLSLFPFSKVRGWRSKNNSRGHGFPVNSLELFWHTWSLHTFVKSHQCVCFFFILGAQRNRQTAPTADGPWTFTPWVSHPLDPLSTPPRPAVVDALIASVAKASEKPTPPTAQKKPHHQTSTSKITVGRSNSNGIWVSFKFDSDVFLLETTRHPVRTLGRAVHSRNRSN